MIDKASFENITNIWLRNIKDYSSKFDIPIILVGNKNDDILNRVVPKSQGDVLMKLEELKFYETSAKFGSNIDKIFEEAIAQVLSVRD